ncbi:hypothetical protein O3822_06335 [Gemella sanguinis]|uniref:hypothetical protein n=1 Tax=Gemella sanguinis TaxID=84135 RepID=UPI00352F23AA
MYKITRVEVVTTGKGYSLNECINIYINEELQEDEFLLHIEYFKDNEEYSTYPEIAYLHIAKLIQ